MKFRTDCGQLDADNKEASALVQDSELEGLLFPYSSLPVHFFICFTIANLDESQMNCESFPLTS